MPDETAPTQPLPVADIVLPSITKARSQIAFAVRDGADPDTLAGLRRELRVAVVARDLSTLVQMVDLTAENEDLLVGIIKAAR